MSRKINYWSIMTRRKPMPSQECEDSKLGRVFGVFDLTALGVSATLGVGVYVLAGHVAKIEAGPSVILSFLIAAAASFLAGLFYAEFSSRVPKSGSAYIFTYVAIGEFVAFIIGWNLLLEYIIGSASIAKGLSLYIDSLINDTMKDSFKSIAPISLGSFLSSYFDFFAFSSPLVLGFALAFGLRTSAGMNNILCVLNVGVVIYVVIAVLLNANLSYWQIDPALVPVEYRNATGAGGFFPFGFSGTLKGAATCFFGFVGFDCIATTGEEVRNPRKSVPQAILYSLIIIFLAYFGVSLLTLMWPYYLLDPEAPLPHAFHEIGWNTSKWIVAIGGIVGLLASLFGAMFPLPRILYAMAMDGLIFRKFGTVSERFKTPVFGTLSAALLTSCFAALFDLAALVNMLSIGVLLAYTVVAISIIVLGFSNLQQEMPIMPQNGDRQNETSNLLRPGYTVTVKGFFLQLIRMNSSRHPNTISMTVVSILIASYCAVSFMLAVHLSYGWDAISNGESSALVILIILVTLLLLFCLLISIQPRQVFASRTKPFLVPIVPFLPAISVFINIYLMLMLDYFTWIRFGVWMIIGMIIYFPYAWYFNKNKVTDIDVINKINECDEVVSSTREPINVIIINENQQTQSEAISDKFSDDNDSHLAIEMLDTILENEEYDSESTKSSLSIKPESFIQMKEKDLPKIQNEVEDLRKIETINPNLMRIDLQSEIDDILALACEVVAQKTEFHEDVDDVDDESIFQNQKFLLHLNDLIMKSNQDVIDQSQTVRRKNKNENSSLEFKDSKTLSNLNEEKVFEDDSKCDELNKDEGPKREKKLEIVISPMLANDTHKELSEKFAMMRKRQAAAAVKNNDLQSPVNETIDRDRGDFREKLEKLLSTPPTHAYLIRPIPLPRTVSNISQQENIPSNEEEIRRPAPRKNLPSTPQSATMIRQRKIFDEVLEKIKRNDHDNEGPKR